MNVKKTIKKIVALGAGATMVGATIMGAMAGLEDYPGMWISDGTFDGKIVVGTDAATSDVLGAIDIAASIQAASTVSQTVEVPGAAGKTVLTGDVVEVGESNDLLSLNEPIGDVRETITEFELAALKGGVISTDEGTTAYKQYLRFKVANASELFPTAVIYGENDAPNEEVSDWLFVAEGNNDVTQDAFFEWEIEFEEGLEAEIETTATANVFELQDLEDEVFNIFGTDFVFVDSELRGDCSTPDLKLEFLAGDVTDVLQEGETKTYTIDGKDYEVTLVFVSNPNSGTVESKLSVNGELTDAMSDGDTDILSDGLEIGVQEILVSERGGIVEFFLGATKIAFRDTDTSDTTGDTNNGFNNDVEVTEETIEEGWVSIAAQCLGASLNASEEFELTSIKYRLTADAITGTTNIYVPSGHGLREFLDEPEGMLSPNFDIKYEGFLDVGDTPIEIYARGDDEYRVTATNRQGNTYDIPYVEVTRAGVYRFGEDDTEDLLFVESANFETNLNETYNGSPGQCALISADFYIDQDDYFVVWNGRDDLWDDQAFSHIVEFESIDTTEQVLTFDDLAVGTKEFTYRTDTRAVTNCTAVTGEGDLILGGNVYTVYVDNSSTRRIAADLNADGAIEADRGRFAVKGGGVIEFDNASAAPNKVIDLTSDEGVIFVLHTESSEFDETDEGGEELEMNLTESTDNQVSMTFQTYERMDKTAGAAATLDRQNNVFIEGIGDQATTGRFASFQFDPSEPDDLDDHELEVTDYGVMYDLFDPTGNEPEELTLMYPTVERGVQVFVTAGSVTATKGGPGAVTTTQVNPIAVGLAVLDVDAPAVGTENMIAIGGPCINMVSAELLGAAYPACGEQATALGFEAGKGVIKLFESSNAILVAGWSAQDSLGASYVLADFDDYTLVGNELEIVVADLATIDVNPVS